MNSLLMKTTLDLSLSNGSRFTIFQPGIDRFPHQNEEKSATQKRLGSKMLISVKCRHTAVNVQKKKLEGVVRVQISKEVGVIDGLFSANNSVV